MTCRNLISSWFERFWAFAGAFNIRTKILGIVLGLVMLLGFGITLQVRLALARTMTTQLQEQSISVSRDLAARATDLILLNDLYGLHRLLQETQANNTNVLYAFALDPQGRVLAHTFGDKFPLALLEQNTASPSEHHRTVILETDEGLVWDTAVPVLDGRAGIARVGLSDATVRQAVRDVTGQLILTTILVSLVGVTAATFLTWMQEKVRGLFVAATANRIDLLPAEMIRKGRFDEVFFVDLPTHEEQLEIFQIHLRRRGVDPARFHLEELMQFTKGWTGAEIEQLVVSALTTAKLDNRTLTGDDL